MATAADEADPIPEALLRGMGVMRGNPMAWFKVFAGPTAGELARRLSGHPAARGFAWAVRGDTVYGSYRGEAAS